MTVDANTPWRHMGRVPYAVWRSKIMGAGGLVEAAQQDVWEACGDDSALMLEFLHAESSYASDFAAIPAAKRNPWNLQIAGQGLTFTTIREAALAWRNRLYDPLYKQGIYLKTNTIADLIRTYAPASDGNDTEGYIRKVVAGINANGFDPPVTTPATPEVPVEETPVTLSIVNRVIGVQANAPATLLNAGAGRLRPIIHNTDNPSRGADALMHAQFVANGGGDDNVSFHFAVDSGQAVQILPLNRVAYHASDGCDSRSTDVGCFDGIAIENCDNADGDINKTFDNLAELLACIEFGDPRIDYGGRPKADFVGFIDRTLGHHDTAWDGKWCPSDFLNEYGDPGYKVELKKRAKAKLAAKQGTTPAPEPVTYAKPQPPAAGDSIVNSRIFLAHSQEYTTKKDVTPRLYADPTSSPTGPVIKKGTKVKTSHVVSDVGESADLTAVLVDGSRIPVREVLV